MSRDGPYRQGCCDNIVLAIRLSIDRALDTSVWLSYEVVLWMEGTARHSRFALPHAT